MVYLGSFSRGEIRKGNKGKKKRRNKGGKRGKEEKKLWWAKERGSKKDDFVVRFWKALQIVLGKAVKFD